MLALAQVLDAIAAVQSYRVRRDRAEYPDGTFDRRGRFYLSEKCARCAPVRRPSASWPYSELVHGRAAVHVAGLYGVDPRIVRAAARRLDRAS